MEPTNKNGEINEALEEFELEQKKGFTPKPSLTNSSEITQKAEEAFREFQMKQNKQQIPEQKDSEIGKALREYELKTAKDELQTPQAERGDDEGSKMAKWVIKYSGGLIKDKYQANYVLLGMVVLFFLLAGYFFYVGLSSQ